MMIKLFEQFVDDKDTIRLGSRGDNVKELQQNLVKLGFELNRYGIDSKFGKETLGQVKSLFSILKEIPKYKSLYENITNYISPDTQAKIKELADSDAPEYIQEYFDKKYKNIDIIGKEIIANNIENPEEFVSKLKQVSKALKINPNWLVAVMFKESGISPVAPNKMSGATGLIQFMPDTAKGLGTTTDQLKRMSAIDQLDYVYKYYKPYTGKIKNYTDLYSVTFYPYMIGKDSDYIVGSERSKKRVKSIAKQNKAIDINKDQEVSYDEFKRYAYKRLPEDWIRNIS